MPNSRSPLQRLGIALGLVLLALVLLGVFGLYTAPDFMVMMADQVWACF